MMISVVIPALDEADSIAATLQPLQGMRGRGHEVIIVDGGSQDDTVRRAEPWADWSLASERGRARQMNAGTAVARGDILWFLHADTLAPENAGAAILGALAGGRRVWGRFAVRLSGRHPLLRIVAAAMNLRSCLSGIATGDQGIFVLRETFAAAGRFPELPLMEDIAISRRLRRTGARAACASGW